jgi:alkylhydroperoxidase family enzyme
MRARIGSRGKIMTSESRTSRAPSAPAFDIEAREQEILGKTPRVSPLDSPDVVAAALENTGRLRGATSGGSAPVSMAEVPELVVTLLRHPSLYQRLTDMSVQLMRSGALTARDRELATLRTGWLCQAPYEWGEHVRLAKRAGIRSEEIERITQGSSAPGWSEHEAALMRAAEELHENAMISDATWAILARHLDERQLIELPVLIGQFTLVAYLQNALRLRLGEGNIGLRAR